MRNSAGISPTLRRTKTEPLALSKIEMEVLVELCVAQPNRTAENCGVHRSHALRGKPRRGFASRADKHRTSRDAFLRRAQERSSGFDNLCVELYTHRLR